jgi:hypothetical protein
MVVGYMHRDITVPKELQANVQSIDAIKPYAQKEASMDFPTPGIVSVQAAIHDEGHGLAAPLSSHLLASILNEPRHDRQSHKCLGERVRSNEECKDGGCRSRSEIDCLHRHKTWSARVDELTTAEMTCHLLAKTERNSKSTCRLPPFFAAWTSCCRKIVNCSRRISAPVVSRLASTWRMNLPSPPPRSSSVGFKVDRIYHQLPPNLHFPIPLMMPSATSARDVSPHFSSEQHSIFVLHRTPSIGGPGRRH